ncbi:MAG: DoxX family protein [Opitutaceae bacterium]
MKILSKLHALLATVGHLLQSPVLLVIRLFWGWHFMGTGWGKLHNLDGVTKYFASLDIPAPHLNAIMAASTELVGGTLLLLGLFSRFASAALIGVMCVAYATAEKESLHALFSNPDKFLGADPFLFLYASVLVFAFGPGRIAVDAFILKEKKG